jgi:hypothetical protein
MACNRVTQKSYATRPSPPYHAGECKDQVKEGNDGRTYKSIQNKRGIYTWMPSRASNTTRKSKGKQYEIHYNGSRPFFVEDFPKQKQLTLFSSAYSYDSGKDEKAGKIATFKYLNCWLGDPSSDSWGDYEKGSTILLQKNKTKFIFIGSTVVEFELAPGDAPVKFMNPIGNSDVPLPYLIGKQNIYLFSMKDVRVPIELFDLTKDIYAQFWGHDKFKSLEDQGVELGGKTLH